MGHKNHEKLYIFATGQIECVRKVVGGHCWRQNTLSKLMAKAAWVSTKTEITARDVYHVVSSCLLSTVNGNQSLNFGGLGEPKGCTVVPRRPLVSNVRMC